MPHALSLCLKPTMWHSPQNSYIIFQGTISGFLSSRSLTVGSLCMVLIRSTFLFSDSRTQWHVSMRRQTVPRSKPCLLGSSVHLKALDCSFVLLWIVLLQELCAKSIRNKKQCHMWQYVLEGHASFQPLRLPRFLSCYVSAGLPAQIFMPYFAGLLDMNCLKGHQALINCDVETRIVHQWTSLSTQFSQISWIGASLSFSLLAALVLLSNLTTLDSQWKVSVTWWPKKSPSPSHKLSVAS